MEEKSYYLRNKHKWKKGGKYYYYKPMSERNKDLKLQIKRGKFLLSFN